MMTCSALSGAGCPIRVHFRRDDSRWQTHQAFFFGISGPNAAEPDAAGVDGLTDDLIVTSFAFQPC